MKYWLLLLGGPICYLLIFGCATVSSPEGGVRDTKAPVVSRSSPALKTTNFRGNEVVFHFNEFIQVKDAQNSLLISPPLSTNPKIKVSGKRLSIRWKDTLLSNSTYSLNFGDAISDITEGNVLGNFQFAFATGNILDSLKKHVQVFNAQTLQSEKNVYVGFYKPGADSMVRHSRPYYYSKTNEQGECDIYNMHEGPYRMFALKDENFNMLYDLPNESIAFCDSMVFIKASNASSNLYLFKPVSPKLFITSSKLIDAGTIQLIYSQPVSDISSITANMLPVNYFLSATQDTLNIYQNRLDEDSVSVIINHGVLDTIKLKCVNFTKDSLSAKKYHLKVALSKTSSSSISSKNNGLASKINTLVYSASAPALLYFNHPVQNCDLSKIIIIKDSLQQLPLKKPEIFSTTKYVTQLNLAELISEPFLHQGSEYLITFRPGAFTGSWGKQSDSSTYRIKVGTETELGNVILNLVPKDSLQNYLIFLSDKNEQLIAKKMWQPGKKVEFNNLSPTNYHLKILKDENKNGKWDTGDYYLHKQPEKFYPYQKEVSVKPNWDIEIEMKIE